MEMVRLSLLVLCLSAAGCAGGDVEDLPPTTPQMDGSTGPIGCDCLSTEFCNVSQVCESLYGRNYSVVVSAQFGDRDIRGECWDADCSFPDPLLVLSLDDVEVGRTTPVQNRSAETFQSFPVMFTEGRELTAEILNAAGGANNVILRCHVPLTPDQVQAGASTCTWSGGSRLTVSFSRQ